MIDVLNITKTFNNKKIIDNFSLNIKSREFISIIGESGAGKTTLLNIMGLLEKPDSGSVIINGIKNPNSKEILLLQRNHIGYLFQNYALIENETVEKNLEIALKYKKNLNKTLRKEKINEVLKKLDLLGFNKKKIYELSGGEQQRIALARLILKKCDIIFADEPTGNLDKKNKYLVFDTLKELNKEGVTIILITHDFELTKHCNKVIKISKISN